MSISFGLGSKSLTLSLALVASCSGKSPSVDAGDVSQVSDGGIDPARLLELEFLDSAGEPVSEVSWFSSADDGKLLSSGKTDSAGRVQLDVESGGMITLSSGELFWSIAGVSPGTLLVRNGPITSAKLGGVRVDGLDKDSAGVPAAEALYFAACGNEVDESSSDTVLPVFESCVNEEDVFALWALASAASGLRAWDKVSTPLLNTNVSVIPGSVFDFEEEVSTFSLNSSWYIAAINSVSPIVAAEGEDSFVLPAQSEDLLSIRTLPSSEALTIGMSIEIADGDNQLSWVGPLEASRDSGLVPGAFVNSVSSGEYGPLFRINGSTSGDFHELLYTWSNGTWFVVTPTGRGDLAFPQLPEALQMDRNIAIQRASMTSVDSSEHEGMREILEDGYGRHIPSREYFKWVLPDHFLRSSFSVYDGSFPLQ